LRKLQENYCCDGLKMSLYTKHLFLPVCFISGNMYIQHSSTGSGFIKRKSYTGYSDHTATVFDTCITIRHRSGKNSNPDFDLLPAGFRQ
jgi:hypothetical protein